MEGGEGNPDVLVRGKFPLTSPLLKFFITNFIPLSQLRCKLRLWTNIAFEFGPEFLLQYKLSCEIKSQTAACGLHLNVWSNVVVLVSNLRWNDWFASDCVPTYLAPVCETKGQGFLFQSSLLNLGLFPCNFKFCWEKPKMLRLVCAPWYIYWVVPRQCEPLQDPSHLKPSLHVYVCPSF